MRSDPTLTAIIRLARQKRTIERALKRRRKQRRLALVHATAMRMELWRR
jgi:hypothetical protein